MVKKLMLCNTSMNYVTVLRRRRRRRRGEGKPPCAQTRGATANRPP
jgi:hypothetical protein